MGKRAVLTKTSDQSTPNKQRQTEPILNSQEVNIALAVFALVLAVYLLTLSPSVGSGDSGDITVAAAVTGIAHPPGYPLLTLINKLFMLLPFGSIAFRTNLTSAVFDAGAAALVYLTVRKLGAGNIPGLVAATSLAFSLLFWTYSIFAEVFALNNLIVILAIFLLLLWERSHDDKFLYSFVLVNGLGISHHHTIVLLWPGFAWFLFSSGITSFITVRRLGTAIFVFLVGLTPYIYIPIAAATHPPYSMVNAETLEGFVRLVTRADYGSFSLTGASSTEYPRIVQLQTYAKVLSDQFTVFGLAIAMYGAYFIFRRNPKFFYATITSFVLTGPAFLLYVNAQLDLPYAFPTIEKFYILSELFVVIWLGCGIQGIIERMPAFAMAGKYSIQGLIPMAFIALPAVLLASNYQTADFSGRYLVRNLGVDILNGLPPNSRAYFIGDDAIFVASYLQLVEGIRPDVERVPGLANLYLTSKEKSLQAINEQLDKGTSVFLCGTYPEGFDKDFLIVPQGVVMQILPKEARLDLDQLRASNENYWAKLANAPELKRTSKNAIWESRITTYYAIPVYNLAILNLEARRFDDAIALFKKTLEIAPDFAEAYDYLGGIYSIEKRDYSNAIYFYEKFLEIRPYSSPAPEVRNDLANLKLKFGRR